MKVAATGWFTVGFAPMTMMTSALRASENDAVTAPDPTFSINAATDEAWQRRVQWSTLLVLKPARTIFCTRYASSFEPLAEPKPARALAPSRSRIFTKPSAALSRASSQVAGRKCVSGFAGSKGRLSSFGASSRRIIGVVRRWSELT